MNKKVSELIEANELTDEDILMILQSGQNKKIKAKNALKNKASQADLDNLTTAVENRLATAILRAGMSQQMTISGSQDRKEVLMPFDAERYKTGELSLSNNKIVVGKNINTILVNVQLYFYTAVDLSTSKIITIRRNESDQGTISSRCGLALKQTVVNACAIMPVTEGDEISVNITASESDVIDNNQSQCFFEVVKLS